MSNNINNISYLLYYFFDFSCSINKYCRHCSKEFDINYLDDICDKFRKDIIRKNLICSCFSKLEILCKECLDNDELAIKLLDQTYNEFKENWKDKYNEEFKNV